ncbi:4-coumarate--CoA ligase 4-like [Odontomachus brunneus]|uniref:4-coumarate--CoA ligase 4-like n=1 Tax=Odontomachus brunneus TaxID=486640 RepID=UPI0013F1BF13|nr:4-coumarate--CoA ligase 4-like [Odontomachus brunneus]XP_032676824.1 4-coumarate--CoA ligase 4-like [Odontomachus brunneus]XP_032676831.1 4-coumarate--CoA ligase 4-like [Odontomachus brunneus]XP_032676839.1 4-coumarate--CoA ligase 4-like [Odontomachus brunneus]XP_032676845.1 4-coumarate--CoA ligase 4-like [Odontomachus brunneus]XP_032676853.1 4-coumarate--CoA ligase 4-like [Odontomachus brunneus]XP_032676862.1 4-coumarate--CoA ligase 4-like [Odontomachus brunneus]
MTKFINNMSYPRCSFMIKDNIIMGKKVGCDGLESMNIGKLILQTLNSDLNYVAQVDAETGREITFTEIRNNSVKLAIWMKFEEVYPGDLIGICTDYPVMLYAILACLYIGAVPIVRQYNKCTDLETSCDFARVNPKILFVNRIQSKECESTKNSKINNFEMVSSLIVPGSSRFLYKKFSFAYDVLIANIDKCYNVNNIEMFDCTELDDFRLQTAMIVYTRGIEGPAKAVKIPHKAIIAPVIYEVFSVLPGNVGMLMEHHFLYLNLILTIQSILMYKRIVIFKEGDMMKFWRAIEIYKVNWVRLETNMSQAILNSIDSLTADISSLKTLIFSGSSMKYCIQADLDRLLPETSVISLYGTTETGIISFQRFNRKCGSSGKVGRNINFMITDISGTVLASNIPGKIWCKCYGMSNTYYDANIVSIQITNDKGWYDTGDIGYYDDDGDIYVINRAADLVCFKETYYSPTIVENLIKEHPNVDDVAVVEKPNNTNEQVLVAFITEKTGKHVEKQEIINITTNITWTCMKLHDVLLLDKMWYRLDGNIDRNYLRYKANFGDTFIS